MSPFRDRAQGRPPWVALALGLAVGLWPAAGRAPARAQGPSGLDGLLDRFAAVPGLVARFHEEKRIGLLAAPLVSEGMLRYARPGRLVRETTRPERSTLRIAGDRLQIDDAEGRRDLDLASQPIVRSFVDAFLGVLEGDRHGLERAFTVTYAPAGSGWRLTLVPRGATMQRLIRFDRDRGHGRRPRAPRRERDRRRRVGDHVPGRGPGAPLHAGRAPPLVPDAGWVSAMVAGHGRGSPGPRHAAR